MSEPSSSDQVSPRLYNADLAPTAREGRAWGAYNIFTLWANDVHSLGNYTFAIVLFALGLGGWQILLALGLGGIFLFLLLNLSGFMGEKTGVPFPVMSRIAFGTKGAQVPAVVRGVVAIVWFGIQTYLASVVLNILIMAIAPGAADLDQNSFLGLSTLGWISFLVLWAVQLVVVSYGMEMIRRYEAVAGPVILVTMASLAVWMFVRAGGSLSFSTPDAKTGLDMWSAILGAARLWVVIYGTFVLNFCDFTRNASSKGAIVRGNFAGIPVNTLVFGAIVVLLTGSQYSIDGRIIEKPEQIVQQLPVTLLLVLACLALIVLTIAVNLLANFVAPIYTLNNLFPQHLDFRRAGLISGVIGLVILPWNLYNTPEVVAYFLGGLGAVLGPLFGIIMVDYWLIRGTQINVPDLYVDSASGDYAYRSGMNPRAVGALVPSAALALLVAFLPALESASDFSWFIGAAGGGLIYWFVAESCEGNLESYLAAVGVMDAVTRYQEPYDAVVQAGYGEHGREGLQEILEVPVVDITEAAASTALYLGHRFSVVTTLDRTVPLIEDRLKLAGLDARCASVRASGLGVLELESEPERAVRTIVDQCRRAVEDDLAEVICLGCGGMAELEAQVSAATGVPIVDGVRAAVVTAEGLVRQGLSTSKVRTYAAPRTKRLTGWPLPE